MITDTWSARMVANLTQLWAEGYSASMIGERLGISRNAVIGKVHRLRLPKPSVKVPHVSQKRVLVPRQAVSAASPPPPKEKPREVPPQVRVLPVVPVVAVPAIIPRPVSAIPGSQLVTLQKRTSDQCRWPVNEGSPYLYCGAPRVPGKSYCAHHQRMLLRPPKHLPVKVGAR
nr:hypothetical protein [uncultured archaeon]